MRRRSLALTAVLATLVVPTGANASTLIDRNAHGATLKVNSAGQALVSYTARGKRWNVLAWGAVNAVPPALGAKQVDFKLDYSGGWGTYKKDVWKSFANTCSPYTGQPLAWRVTSCTAGDGSHWALQAWQRMLPNYGLAPTPKQAVWELRLSHWTGELPALTVNLDWAYRKYDHLFGTFIYDGAPVTVSSRRRAATRSTRSDATSMSTRSTRRTAWAGSGRTASSPIGRRDLLLRVLPARRTARRTRGTLPRDDHRAGCDARRDVAGRSARRYDAVVGSAARRRSARALRVRQSLQARLRPSRGPALRSAA